MPSPSSFPLFPLCRRGFIVADKCDPPSQEGELCVGETSVCTHMQVWFGVVCGLIWVSALPNSA